MFNRVREARLVNFDELALVAQTGLKLAARQLGDPALIKGNHDRPQRAVAVKCGDFSAGFDVEVDLALINGDQLGPKSLGGGEPAVDLRNCLTLERALELSFSLSKIIGRYHRHGLTFTAQRLVVFRVNFFPQRPPQTGDDEPPRFNFFKRF